MTEIHTQLPPFFEQLTSFYHRHNTRTDEGLETFAITYYCLEMAKSMYVVPVFLANELRRRRDFSVMLLPSEQKVLLWKCIEFLAGMSDVYVEHYQNFPRLMIREYLDYLNAGDLEQVIKDHRFQRVIAEGQVSAVHVRVEQEISLQEKRGRNGSGRSQAVLR